MKTISDMDSFFNLACPWTKLPYPFKERSKQLMINGDEYVILATMTTDVDIDGLYKFNVKHNTWTLVIDLDKGFTQFRCTNMLYSSWALNKEKQLIYVWDKYNPFMMNISQNKILKVRNLDIRSDSTLFIHNQLHLLNCQPNDHAYVLAHIICDENMSNPQTIHSFHEYGRRFEGYGFVYIKQIESILLFGGWDNNSNSFDLMYKFSILTQQWQQLATKLPVKLSHFGYCSTRFGEYIIITAGWIEGIHGSNNIFVYDVNKRVLNKCTVNSPQSGYCSAIIVSNKYNDEISVFGYINDCYKQFGNIIQQISQDLILLISKWICNEYMYVIMGSKHWKINVDHIISNIVLCENSVIT